MKVNLFKTLTPVYMISIEFCIYAIFIEYLEAPLFPMIILNSIMTSLLGYFLYIECKEDSVVVDVIILCVLLVINVSHLAIMNWGICPIATMWFDTKA